MNHLRKPASGLIACHQKVIDDYDQGTEKANPWVKESISRQENPQETQSKSDCAN